MVNREEKNTNKSKLWAENRKTPREQIRTASVENCKKRAASE